MFLPWCGDREGWLPWWRPGTVEPFLRPAGGPDIGIDPGSRRPGGLPRPALPDACVAADPSLGARRLRDLQADKARWTTFADIERNEFDLIAG